MSRNLIYLLLLGLLGGYVGVDAPLTIYLAGDSTMAEKQPEKRPETGWGEFLHAFFDEADVRVENHARNGRSTRTFIEEGRWQAVVEKLQAGDYVFIQFGHNDQPKEKGSHTPADQFRANLIRFAGDVRAKEATPVLLTPVVRRRFDDDGRFYDTHADYPDIIRRVAAEHDVPLIDMHRKSEAVLRRYGAEDSKALFLHLAPGEHPNYPDGLSDNTHFSPLGAETVAGLAADGVRELGLTLASFLLASAPPALVPEANGRHSNGKK